MSKGETERLILRALEGHRLTANQLATQTERSRTTVLNHLHGLVARGRVARLAGYRPYRFATLPAIRVETPEGGRPGR